MKILYLNLDRGIPVCGDKGASVHVRAFIAAAHRLGHEVALACTTLGEGNPPPPALILPPLPRPAANVIAERGLALGYTTTETDNDPVLRRELSRLAVDAAAPPHILSALRRAGFVPDMVYERHALFHTAGVEVAARLGVPRLLEVNAPLVEEQRRFRGLHLEVIAHQAEQKSYQHADAVIAVSHAVARHVAAVTGRERNLHEVPNGVDLAAHAGMVEAGKMLRQRHGISSDERLAGFVGSFKPWHGVPFLLEAFAAVAEKLPLLRLAAVGDGPEREAIAARAAALGLQHRVLLTGRVPHADIPAWLAAMDFTVAPYLPQPDFYFSPLKIAESMAAGRPVLAPDIGAIGEMVLHGRNGLLYEPGDLASCIVGLTELADDQEDRFALSRQAQLDAQHWGWDRIVARILSLAPAHSTTSRPAA
jgi:glycosyltransferase involved in cell wall biosynthesis